MIDNWLCQVGAWALSVVLRRKYCPYPPAAPGTFGRLDPSVQVYLVDNLKYNANVFCTYTGDVPRSQHPRDMGGCSHIGGNVAEQV